MSDLKLNEARLGVKGIRLCFTISVCIYAVQNPAVRVVTEYSTDSQLTSIPLLGQGPIGHIPQTLFGYKFVILK